MSGNVESLLEQYKAYIDSKDKFVDRNFGTNKFFILVIIGLFALIFFTKNSTLAYDITPAMIFTFIGMGLCFLWWSNVDSYDTLIKIKYNNVIDVMEENLPFPCHKTEHEVLQKLREEKKVFLFSDMQKAIASGMFTVFMVVFLFDFVPLIVKAFY